MTRNLLVFRASPLRVGHFFSRAARPGAANDDAAHAIHGSIFDEIRRRLDPLAGINSIEPPEHIADDRVIVIRAAGDPQGPPLARVFRTVDGCGTSTYRAIVKGRETVAEANSIDLADALLRALTRHIKREP